MPLRFVASAPHHSIYQDRDGNVVNLLNGGMQRAIETSALPELWRQFVADGQYDADDNYLDEDDWIESIRDSLIDPQVALSWCTDCNALLLPDQSHEVGRDDDVVCGHCFKQYTACVGCENSFERNQMRATLDDDMACLRCIEYEYTFCNTCDGYFRGDDDGVHDHRCTCESPQQSFSVPFQGARLHNDDETVVTLPAGTITDEGLRAIQQMFWSAAYTVNRDEREALDKVARAVHRVGDEWQTRKGNFTKRLSRLVYQELSYKISPDMLGKIGSTARAHSSEISEMTVTVTRDLNLSPEEFGNEDSCWWEGYSDSRCALKSNGGFGLRSFVDSTYGGSVVAGRVWVMPLRLDNGSLVPTFDTTAPDAYVVFNGYGDLSGYVGARVMAQMAGMTYRKISFTCRPMYVNGESAYLVTTEGVAQEHTALGLDLDKHSHLYATESAQITQETANVA